VNPLYTQYMSNPASRPDQPMNPIQKVSRVMQAMRNPAAFVRQSFPDIPAYMQNDPNQILQYLQQTRGITSEQIQDIINQYNSMNF